MELKDFLQRLLDFGLHENYFDLNQIGKLDKTCCPEAKTEVVDFDKTKTSIMQQCGLNQVKSCDALKIIPAAKRLDFIELKGWQHFIQHHSMTNSPKHIDEKIQGFNLAGKIKDSLLVLDLLVKSKWFDMTNSEKQYYREADKYYIVLVDIDIEEDPKRNLAVTLEFLSEVSTPIEQQIAAGLNEELNKIPFFPFENLHPPLLKSCKNIDVYYAVIEAGADTT